MVDTLYLMATIAGTGVAFRSQDVDSVVVVGPVTPVPHAPAHIRGLFALRSRVMTLIDARVVAGAAGQQGRPSTEESVGEGACRAIIVSIAGHHYGLLVDAVEDACFIEGDELAITGRLADGWSTLADAMIEHGGRTLLVIDPHRLVNPPLARAA